MCSVGDHWTSRSLTWREVPPQGNIPGHSPVLSQTAPRGSSPRISNYSTTSWLALDSNSPPWAQFRLCKSGVAHQPCSPSTFQAVQFWHTGSSVSRHCKGVPCHHRAARLRSRGILAMGGVPPPRTLCLRVIVRRKPKPSRCAFCAIT